MVNIFEEERISGNEYKNIRKYEKEMMKILAKSNRQNLLNSRFRNLFIPKKTQSICIMEEFNLLKSSNRVVFTKLK